MRQTDRESERESQRERDRERERERESAQQAEKQKGETKICKIFVLKSSFFKKIDPLHLRNKKLF